MKLTTEERKAILKATKEELLKRDPTLINHESYHNLYVDYLGIVSIRHDFTDSDDPEAEKIQEEFKRLREERKKELLEVQNE